MHDYRPITFKVTCAIARMVLLKRPHFDDSDWREAVKIVAAKQGWASPSPDMLARALGAVERAVQETTGLRRHVPQSQAATSPAAASGWSDADFRALAVTVRAIQKRTARIAVPANVVNLPRERWEIAEVAALDQFYREAETDRIGALKRFAEIAIARPAEWDFAAVRADADRTLSPRHSMGRDCYACRKTVHELAGHHVIQIQHGGSNHVRNRVRICTECHAKIHPWLPKPAQADPSGWFRIGAIGPDAVAVERLLARQRARETTETA